MANEGIMALPQGMGMQGEQGEQPQMRQPQQTVTSADSYDAAQTALGMVNPGEQAALKEALRQNIGDLQLTPQQLDALIQVFEYVSQHPGDYKNLLQKMLEAKVLDEGDMPAEYDPEFIGAMLAVLNEMQQMQAAGAQEPMNLSPTVQGLQPMNMASGGLADVGQYLASKGRGGDSILAHINPEEAAMLKSRGGSGTINPITGLPEFKGGFLGQVFDAVGDAVKGVVNVVKDVLKSPVGRILGTIALATVLGPTAIGMSLGSAGTAALASGAVTLAGGGNIKEALISGAMGYIGGCGTIMGVNPVAAVGGYLPGAAGGALNTGLATGVIGAGIGKLGGMSTEDALKMGLVSGVSAGGMKALGGMGKPESGLSEADFNTRTDMFNRSGTSPEAAKVYLGDNTAEMAAFIKNNPDLNFRVSNPGPIGQIGQTGTAAELLNRPAPELPFTGDLRPSTSISGNAQQPPSAAILGTTELPGVSGQQAALDANNLGAGVERPLLSSNTPPPFSSSYSSPGQQAALDANNLGMTPGTQPTGFFDKMVTGAKDMYNEYLSPSRPGMETAGIFQKYAPLAAAGTAAIAAFGGMDSSPAEIDEMTATERARYMESRQRAKERRDFMEKGGYGLEKPVVNAPYNPIVPASYSTAPVGMPGTVVPGGVTQNPAGVAQPYNVAGLYGVPLIYGPDGQPRRMAQGGPAKMTQFPRRDGPINGPGTGTSDDIPAMLSDGEFVFTAKAVRNAGGGSRRKGAARMYKLMKKLEGGAVKGN